MSLEVRFEVMHVYSAQHMLLPSTATHAVGIHNAAATSEKEKTLASIREIQVHKHWTKLYSQKGLTAMLTA